MCLSAVTDNSIFYDIGKQCLLESEDVYDKKRKLMSLTDQLSVASDSVVFLRHYALYKFT